MKGVILAAGKGTRLYPLTLEIPKPLIPIHQKPLLTYLVEWFSKNNINDICIVTNIDNKDGFEEWERTMKRNGTSLTYLWELKPTGTLFPLIKEIPQNYLGKDFVVTYCDELKDFDLQEMIKFHLKQKPTITMGLHTEKKPEKYGQVKLEGNKVVRHIKTDFFVSTLVDSGIFIMNKKIFQYKTNDDFAMLEDIYPLLIKEKELIGFPHLGRWFDCGTFERWENAIKNW